MKRFLVWVVVFLGACSYSLKKPDFNAGVAGDSGRVYSFFIPVVENLTARAGAEASLTQALREGIVKVRNVRLVSSPDKADYLLLGTLQQYLVRRATTRLGDSSSATEGGLADKQMTASQINLKLVLRVRVLERPQVKGSLDVTKVSTKSALWDQVFEREAIFEATSRDSDLEGASSAPFINASREQIQIKLLAESLTQGVLDKLILDF